MSPYFNNSLPLVSSQGENISSAAGTAASGLAATGLVQLWSPAQHLLVRTRLPVLYLTTLSSSSLSLLPLFMNVRSEAAFCKKANVDDVVVQGGARWGWGPSE